MRLALVAHVFGFRDGQGRVNYEVARAALGAGHEVTLITESAPVDLAADRRLRVAHIAKSSLPTQLLKNVSFALRSAVWLRKHAREFDVIQANGFLTFAKADIVAAHFVHGAWLRHPFYPFRGSAKPYDLYQRLFTLFSAWQERRVYLGAKRVIAVSRKTAREVEALGVDPSKLRVIYNGVDLDAYHPGIQERAHFGLPEGVPLALFVGDLRTPRKNFGMILQAILHVPGVFLAVAGDTAGSPYPAMAERLGLGKKVFFTGKTGEVARLMRSVDFFVFPSRYEAHPLVVMEAMASGLPVIVSSNVAAGENFATATLVLRDAEDALALAECITELLGSPDRMQSLALAARAYAEQMSWSNSAAKYLEVYAEFNLRPT